MSLSPYLAHRACSLTAGHPLSVACRCLWGRGTEKQRMWKQGSNGLQDTRSLPQRRCLPGRRNYRKDKRGGVSSQGSVAPAAWSGADMAAWVYPSSLASGVIGPLGT